MQDQTGFSTGRKHHAADLDALLRPISFVLCILLLGSSVGCRGPYTTVSKREAIAAIPDSKMCILSFTFDPGLRSPTEGSVLADTPQNVRAGEQLTRRLAELHFNSTSSVMASRFHLVPTKFADLTGEVPGFGSGSWNALPKPDLSQCTGLGSPVCLAGEDGSTDQKAQIARTLLGMKCDYGLIVWDQFGIGADDGINFVLSRTRIADKSGEIIWRFGAETEFNDKSIEGILNETFFAPTSEEHFVEIHRQYIDSYPLLIRELIEEDISGRPHKSSLADYLGVRNPVKSFYMPQVHQTEN